MVDDLNAYTICIWVIFDQSFDLPLNSCVHVFCCFSMEYWPSVNELLQVIIFVKSVQRCIALAQLLIEQNFPAICIHRGMEQEERWVPVIMQ